MSSNIIIVWTRLLKTSNVVKPNIRRKSWIDDGNGPSTPHRKTTRKERLYFQGILAIFSLIRI
jgi:hypothetical protein